MKSNKNKYKKIVFLLSVIVAIFTINIFTFPAITAGNACDIYGCVNTFDTSDLIEINLYDYGDNINDMYKSNPKYPGFQQSLGVAGNENINNNVFAFHLGDAIVDNLEAGTAGAHEGTLNTNVGHTPASGFINSTLVNGYPALIDGTSLKYLFNSEQGYAIKQNTNNNLSHLFQYNESKEEYFYSSYNNHAEFVTENGVDRFRVYNSKITSNHYIFPFGNFLPLNSISEETTKTTEMGREKFESMIQSVSNYASLPDSIIKTHQQRLYNGLIKLKDTDYVSNIKKGIEHTLTIHPLLNMPSTSIAKLTDDENLKNLYTIDYDKSTNFFFGYEMKFNFIQPKDGKVGENKDNMVFRFEGDDDVWVYIDGVLFLDLSGAHSQLGGEINFNTGEVTYYDFDNTTYDVSKTRSGEPVKFEDIPGIDKSKLNEKGTLKDYSTHTLNFYYMERGAGAGVMTTRFNMPLIKDNAITINKEIATDDKDAIGNKEYHFQVVKADGTVYIPTSYDIYDKDDVKRAGVVDANGIITIGADERAVVSGLKENSGKYYVRELLDTEYENVLVDGVDKLDSNNTTIEIDDKTYTIVSSNEIDISNGSASFTFTNDLKTGKLKINKVLDIKTEGLENTVVEPFKFLVKIDGTPLKVGTPYKIGNNNYTVQESGIIELKQGEEAIIDKIIEGSEFTVVEDLSSRPEFTDSYKVNGTDAGKKATGVISATTDASVVVTNTEKMGAYIEIPVNKATTNPDGVKHTYEFTLTDVDKNKTISTKSITVDENGIGSGIFKVEYSQLAHPNKETTYNYQIKEVINASDNYTLYDTSTYDITVTVTNDGKFESSYKVVSKNGNTVSDNIIEFNNRRLSGLTIKKTVNSDNSNNSKKFNFNIESSSVDGTFKSSKGDITFTNGMGSVKLSHNESITLYLPYGLNYSITETDKDGYTTTYKVDSSGEIEGNIVTINKLNKDTKVEFINVKGYELPKTGSSGMLVITSIGTISIGISFICLLKRRRGEI